MGIVLPIVMSFLSICSGALAGLRVEIEDLSPKIGHLDYDVERNGQGRREKDIHHKYLDANLHSQRPTQACAWAASAIYLNVRLTGAGLQFGQHQRNHVVCHGCNERSAIGIRNLRHWNPAEVASGVLGCVLGNRVVVVKPPEIQGKDQQHHHQRRNYRELDGGEAPGAFLILRTWSHGSSPFSRGGGARI